MTSNRHDASPTLRRKILERFANQCAACDEASTLVADVAHLFEDATTRPPEADRLVVLCSRCNQAEARAKSPRKPALTELLDPSAIDVRARTRYRNGNYSGAYQSSRLAAYLFEQRGNPATAAACLIDAVSALRPIRWGDLLRATLCELERLGSSRDIGLIRRWLCLDRFALVLYDYRRWRESAEVQEASKRVCDRLPRDEREPGEFVFDRSSSFRREALIRAFTQRLTQEEVSRLLDQLEEHTRHFEINLRFDAFATNLDVAGKIALEIGRDSKVAHRFSQMALEREQKVTHKWVLQEHHWREAAYYYSRRDRRHTLEHVGRALKIFRDHPVVLEPTLGATGPVPHDPLEEVERYGITIAELRERGVAPPHGPPREQPLGLSERNVVQIVRHIAGT